MSQIVTIPADGTQVSALVGKYVYFYVRTALAGFQVSFDGGSTWGTRYQSDQDKPPKVKDKIYFKALNGTAVDVTFDVGDSQFSSQSPGTGAVTATLSNNMADNVEVIPLQLIKVANAGAAVKLSNAALYFRWCVLLAYKNLNLGANNGDIQIGFSGAGNAQPIALSPGDQFTLPIPIGAKVDFQNVWMATAVNGDGVVAIYV